MGTVMYYPFLEERSTRCGASPSAADSIAVPLLRDLL
jgi:hypothetical protein